VFIIWSFTTNTVQAAVRDYFTRFGKGVSDLAPAECALLAGLDRRVAEATQMPVHIADDPLTCVARGTGVVLQDLDAMSRVLVSETYLRPPR
jgi:hypothetical protein